MSKDNKKMISLEISAELKEALRIEAFKRAVNISTLIRDILEAELADTLVEVSKKTEGTDK